MALLRHFIFGLFVSLLLAVNTVALADQPTGKLTLPLSLDEDRLTLQIRIAGRAVDATLDSAATFPMIDSFLVSATEAERLDESVDILGIGGVRTFQVARAGPVQIEALRQDRILAAINAQANQPGHRTIIPVNMLPGRTIDFQFDRNRVEAYSAEPDRKDRSVRSIMAYTLLQGVPFVPVKVNGVEGLALVDTGSDVTYLNSAFAKAAGASFLPDRTMELYGTGPDSSPIRVMRANRFDIGHHRKQDFEILSADSAVFGYVGRSDQPTMVLGMDYLKHFRLQIDREKQEMIFGRKESKSAGRRYHISPMSGRIKRRE
ncbi:retropepsin-like aspartic protease [Hyphomonas sp. FCG-A18]|jgi:predicted aspartyl protease|uniref:retropepsin-like aspartic protease n=1 Tax=Hyphomonas sp. FCG-A18 TaxID=3080019 RepID=UPI002B306726|nr:retropepsin-like aspartic protease [Hyphomonas sp. FCG-A18]